MKKIKLLMRGGVVYAQKIWYTEKRTEFQPVVCADKLEEHGILLRYGKGEETIDFSGASGEELCDVLYAALVGEL